MPKKVKRRNSKPLYVMTTKERLRTWQAKARDSDMTLREWVTRTLDSAQVLRVKVTPVQPILRNTLAARRAAGREDPAEK